MLKKLALACVSVFLLFGVPYACAGEYEKLYVQRGEPTGQEAFEWDTISIRKADGETLYFDVEMALTQPQQMQGLMFRKELADNAGMLFIFDNVSMRSFWMKNTLIPLDMLFVDEAGRIHHIQHKARPLDQTGLTSKFPSKAVLEIAGGLAERYGIKDGDVIVHDIFRNVDVAR